MSKTSASTIPAAPSADRSQNRFNDLVARVKDLFGTKKNDRTTEISDILRQRYDAAKAAGHDDTFNDLVENVFEERKLALKQRDTIVRKYAEIESAKTYPEKAVLSEWVKQQNKLSKYSPDEMLSRNIKDDDGPTSHLAIPDANYQRQVMRAGFETRGVIEMNMARVKSLLEDGCDISESKKEKLKTRYNQSFFQEKMLEAASAAQGAVKQLGRGVYSKTDAVDLNFTQTYNLRREALAREMRSKMDMSRGDISSVMNSMMAQLNASNDPLDIAARDKMRKLFEEEGKKIEEDYKARMDKLDNDVKEQEGAMLKEMQNHVDRSDEMLKYRLLTMFLVFTPLGAFSALGPLAQYFGTLSDIFGPIFEAHKSLGEGFGDAITSERFGFLGQLMDKMEVDKLVELVFDKAPVFHQFSEVFDALTDNDIAQGLMAEGVPLLGSPLVYGAIGAYAALGRAPEELKHNKDIQTTKEKYMGKSEVGLFFGEEDGNFVKKSTGALEKLFKDFENDVTNGWENSGKKKFDGTHARISGFVRKRYGKDKEAGILEEAYIDKKMCEFFLNNVDRAGQKKLVEVVFGDQAVKDLKGGKLDNAEGFVTVGDVVKYFSANHNDAAKKSAREKFLLLAGLDENVVANGTLGKSADDLSARISDAAQASRNKGLQDSAQTKLTQNFYFEIAKRKGMVDYPKDKDGAALIKKRVMDDEITSLKKDLAEIRSLPPRTSTSPLSARDLNLGMEIPGYLNPRVATSNRPKPILARI